ncbi:sensor histidine kinase [Lachnospiraceae bacterium HCP1S3_A8]
MKMRMRMQISLKGILILSYSAIALFIVVALSLFFNIKADRLFEKYAMEQQTSQIGQIRDQLNHLYDNETGLIDENGLETIGYAALQNGFIIHVQTGNKAIDWDTNTHHSEECKAVLSHAEENMKGRYPNFQGSYTEESYSLEHDGEVFGTLKVGYYGPYFLNDQEIQLISSLNHSLLVIGMAALIGAAALGILIARGTVRPITGTIQVAKRIASGEYGVQAETGYRMLETESLVEAINEMSRNLEKEEKQKRQITADVAHELRTPLTNLQSYMEAMIDGIWEPDIERLISCHSEILRLNFLTDQLRELHTLESREWELDREELDFSTICLELSRDFEAQMGQKKITMVMKVKQWDKVYADYFRIKQCMVNLISNAISYTKEGGEIRIVFEKRPQGGCRISVKDSGGGVPAESLPYLFERFYRVDKSRNKKKGGMGIGLSITKAIVEKHGGRIWAENRQSGGLSVIMEFPGRIEEE